MNTLKKGDFFGERALEDSQGKRTANIIANPGENGGNLTFYEIHSRIFIVIIEI